MSTYGDPAINPVWEVRFIIGDTAEPFRLTDAEINYLLGANSDNIYVTAYYGAISIATSASNKATKTVGSLTINYSEIATQYGDRAKMIKDTYLKSMAAPFAGGWVANGQGILLGNPEQENIRRDGL
jgi:hypothetical protein